MTDLRSRRSLLERFSHARVLIVGDIILDEYLTGDCSRISPEAPVPILRLDASKTVPGGAANTAANVTSLGGRATLVGLVGDDEAGRLVSELARSLDVDLIPLRDGRPTTRKTRVLGQHQQLLRMDREVTLPIAARAEEALLNVVTSALATADIVVLSDYAKGLLTERTCQTIFDAARLRGCEVIVDPRPEHAAFYGGCTFMTPNWKEALALLGRGEIPVDETIARDVAAAVSRRFGCNVLLTLGAQGILYMGHDGEQFSVPTEAREVFDVSGAGDTVVAALALARVAGADPAAAVAFANAAAGVVVGKLGTATVAPHELLLDTETQRLLTREQLRRTCDELRARGKRIVTINGAFDLLHAGHLYILEQARQQGDVLVVGLNSDDSVKAYKNPSRPIVPQHERARMLLALRAVDYVHIFDEPVPIDFLEEVRPDVHANGAEYGPDCVEAEVVRRHGGRLHLVDRIPGLATSDIEARIRAQAGPVSELRPVS